jgi:homoserine kinase
VYVRAPASSANLGPGFDCLGLALDLPFDLSDVRPDGGRSERGRWTVVEASHPAQTAFVAAGGDPEVPLWWRSRIPPGRGLGFSGASRVAGAYLAGRRDGLDHASSVDGALVVATQLEGHADNAAASALGGFTVAAGGSAIRLDPPEGLSVVAWWPDRSTSTDASRRVLPERVALDDAAFSLARAATWVAALATGELGALRVACEDRLHQPGRLASRPESASALDALLGHEEVLAAWLSGSGPTVAALVRTTSAHAVAEVLAPSPVSCLAVAHTGVGLDAT